MKIPLSHIHLGKQPWHSDAGNASGWVEVMWEEIVQAMLATIIIQVWISDAKLRAELSNKVYVVEPLRLIRSR